MTNARKHRVKYDFSPCNYLEYCLIFVPIFRCLQIAKLHAFGRSLGFLLLIKSGMLQMIDRV